MMATTSLQAGDDDESDGDDHTCKLSCFPSVSRVLADYSREIFPLLDALLLGEQVFAS
jgi:hypothetical protein